MSAVVQPVQVNNSPLFDDFPMSVHKTVDEFKEYLTKKNRKTFVVDNKANLKFTHNSEGKLVTDFGYGAFNFTTTGFERFCKLLKVPARFVAYLPNENTVKDLYASLYKAETSKINFIANGDKIVGACKKDDPVSTLEVTEKIFGPNSPKKVVEICTYNEKSLMYFVSDSTTPRMNDVIDFGLCASHDDSDGSNPQLDFYFWRQVCTNGAVARSLDKIAKFSGRMNKEQLLTVLSERVNQSLDYVNITFSAAIRNMSEKLVPVEEKRFVKSYLSSKFRFRDNGYLETKFDEEITKKLDVNWYDVMNFITDSAKNFEVDKRHRLMALGGDMVSHFKDRKPTMDVFTGFNEFKRKKLHKESLRD